MSHEDEAHTWRRWDDRDDWFAEPASPRGRAAAEEDWLAGDAEVESPSWPRLSRPGRRRLALAGGAGIALLLLLLWLVGAFGSGGTTAQRPPTTTATRPATTTAPTPAPPAVAAPTKALAPGSTGTEVKRLQRALAQLGYSPGRVDGSYGAGTTAALKRFQQASGLQPDGVLGPKTLRALTAKLAAG